MIFLSESKFILLPQIGCTDIFIIADHIGSAAGNDPAFDQHSDPVSKLEDSIHIMFDKQNAAILTQVCDQLCHALAFPHPGTCHGFIKQE